MSLKFEIREGISARVPQHQVLQSQLYDKEEPIRIQSRVMRLSVRQTAITGTARIIFLKKEITPSGAVLLRKLLL